MFVRKHGSQDFIISEGKKNNTKKNKNKILLFTKELKSRFEFSNPLFLQPGVKL